MGDSPVQAPDGTAGHRIPAWVAGLFAFFTNPWLRLFFAALALAFLLAPLPDPLRLIGLFLAFAAFALPSGGERGEEARELGHYLLEAIVASSLATGIVIALSKDEEFKPEKIVVGVCMAIVLTGIGALTRSSNTMRNVSNKLGIVHSQLKSELNDFRTEIDESRQTTEHLKSTAIRLDEEIKRVDVLNLAARALNIGQRVIDYPPVRPAIDAALGTIRTWSETANSSIGADGETKQDCAPIESAWWRCLETYHCEEQYDLARFELVTNARNYTNILVAIIDQLKDGITRDGNEELVVVQCSTFSPKDFYNFPHGARGYRVYRDLEFYGTYRRAVALLNRRVGLFPHRIVFVDSDKNSSDPKQGDVLERMGWTVDTASAVAIGSARLWCAPYSLPLPQPGTGEAQPDGPPLICSTNWPEVEPGTGETIDCEDPQSIEIAQICPMIPIVKDLPDVQPYQGWKRRARDYTSRLLFNKTYNQGDPEQQSSVIRILDDCSSSFTPPGIPSYLIARENWAWDNLVIAAHGFLSGHVSADDKKRLDDALSAISGIRRNISSKLSDQRSSRTSEAIADQVGTLMRMSQRFDAAIEEMRAKTKLATSDGASPRGYRSMTGLQMGPAEAWLYHFLNLISGEFYERAFKGRPLVPVWDLFCWEFLGLGDDEVRGAAPRTWERDDGAPRGIGERVRFVKVQPGTRLDPQGVDENGVVSAMGFDAKGLQREFTLVGARPKRAANETTPAATDFGDVRWEALLTCEIAPPFSTCRLNFNHEREGLVGDYAKWVAGAWQNSAGPSKEIFERLVSELGQVPPPPEKSG